MGIFTDRLNQGNNTSIIDKTNKSIKNNNDNNNLIFELKDSEYGTVTDTVNVFVSNDRDFAFEVGKYLGKDAMNYFNCILAKYDDMKYIHSRLGDIIEDIGYDYEQYINHVKDIMSEAELEPTPQEKYERLLRGVLFNINNYQASLERRIKEIQVIIKKTITE